METFPAVSFIERAMQIWTYLSSEETAYDNRWDFCKSRHIISLNTKSLICGVMARTETSALVCSVANYGQSQRVKVGHS